jgi:hypothetical protein
VTHAIIRGKNGRRHEVDFGDSPVRVEVHASEETVEIFVEADFETHTGKAPTGKAGFLTGVSHRTYATFNGGGGRATRLPGNRR